MSSLQQQLEEKNGEVSSLQQQLEEKNGEVSSLQQQLEEKNGEVSSLQQQLEEKNGEVSSLQQQLEEKDGRELIDVKEKLALCEADLKQTREVLTAKEREVESVHSQLRERESDLQELQRQLRDFQTARPPINTVTNGEEESSSELEKWSSVLSERELQTTSLPLTSSTSVCREVSIAVHDGSFMIPLWCDVEKSASGLQELQQFIQQYDLDNIMFKANAVVWGKKIEELKKTSDTYRRRAKKSEALCRELNACLNEKEKELGSCYKQLRGGTK